MVGNVDRVFGGPVGQTPNNDIFSTLFGGTDPNSFGGIDLSNIFGSSSTSPFTSSSGTSPVDNTNILGPLLSTLGIVIPGLSLPGSNGRTSPTFPGANPTSTIPNPTKQTTPQNTNLTSLLPLLALLGISGGLNNRPTTQTSTQTSTPNLPANLLPLQQSTIDAYTKSLLGTDLTGYTASGVDDINSNANLAKTNAEETLASHGVTGAAVGTAKNSIDAKRFSDVNKFRQSIPLLQQNLQQQALSNAGGFVNNSKTGLTTNGTTTSSGNILGGAVSGPASLLAYLYGIGRLS